MDVTKRSTRRSWTIRSLDMGGEKAVACVAEEDQRTAGRGPVLVVAKKRFDLAIHIETWRHGSYGCDD